MIKMKLSSKEELLLLNDDYDKVIALCRKMNAQRKKAGLTHILPDFEEYFHCVFDAVSAVLTEHGVCVPADLMEEAYRVFLLAEQRLAVAEIALSDSVIPYCKAYFARLCEGYPHYKDSCECDMRSFFQATLSARRLRVSAQAELT